MHALDKIKVEKEKLLAIVKENRAKHATTHEEAVKKYRELVVENLEKALVEAKEGKKFTTDLELVQPVAFVQEYDRAIGMLEMSLDETITIDVNDYTKLVEDRWQWSNQFKLSNSRYLK